MRISTTIRPRLHSRTIPVCALLCLLVGSSTGTPRWPLWTASRAIPLQTGQGQAQPPRLPEPQRYKDLEPERAITENALIPFSRAPVERALPLIFPVTEATLNDRRSALDCLASAIYYEAGNETEQGRRSVAQVVLNRTRHPAFPSSVCGVVYQGAERPTGCQFTFACDGSLARRPSAAGWRDAQRIALAALSGLVEPAVGMATHYHANYVVPYWASSLDKIVQIDTHIFYRWKGGWGKRASFRQLMNYRNPSTDQPYIGPTVEGANVAGMMEPSAPSAVRLPSPIIADENGKLAQDMTARTIMADTAPPLALRSDEMSGHLAVDENRGELKAQ